MAELWQSYESGWCVEGGHSRFANVTAELSIVFFAQLWQSHEQGRVRRGGSQQTQSSWPSCGRAAYRGRCGWGVGTACAPGDLHILTMAPEMARTLNPNACTDPCPCHCGIYA